MSEHEQVGEAEQQQENDTEQVSPEKSTLEVEENVEQYSTVNVEVTETLDEQVLEPQQEDSPNNEAAEEVNGQAAEEIEETGAEEKVEEKNEEETGENAVEASVPEEGKEEEGAAGEGAAGEGEAGEGAAGEEAAGEETAGEEAVGDKPDEEVEPAVVTEADGVQVEISPVEEEEKPDVPPSDDLPEDETAVISLPVPQEEAFPVPVETELPQPGTPDLPGSVEDEEEEDLMAIEVEPEPEYNRDELVQQYQVAMQERDQLNQQNRTLQHKLSEYFKKKKTDEIKQEAEKTAVDQEQRYMKYMTNLEELRQQLASEEDQYNEVIDELKSRKLEKQAKVEEEWKKAVEFKRAVAMESINSRSGRPIPHKEIEMYEMNEEKKEVEVSQVRLENIKLKNRLKKQECLLKQKEELAEGLHLIDFEQLKIENQTYNEKIEERNEELLKLRKKITTTVQVLTHLKEKLQFVQAESSLKKEELSEIEREVAQKRDILSRTKQARDSLRHENNKLQQKCGLLGNTDLLRDFEVSTDEVSDLEHKLDMLKRTHAELTLSLNGIKKKIEMARDNQS